MKRLDGVLFSNSEIGIKHILDGTSNTMLVGETFHDFEDVENNGFRKELSIGNRQDHWYFGSDDIDTNPGFDMSEGIGSTGVPMNLQNLGPNQCSARVARVDRMQEAATFLRQRPSRRHERCKLRRVDCLH